MNKSIPSDKIYVKSFPGAMVEDMNDYVKPAMKFNPDLIIVHVGTNDIRTEKKPEHIAEEIIKLALKIKTDENEVAISGLIPRNDELNQKTSKVNDFLKIKTSNFSLGFIENENFEPNIHLNNSGLHLNYKGTVTLASNFINYIKI